jgi:hypothetical protein
MVITDTLVFPLITFQIYNVFRYKNLVLHFDTTIQSQYTSSKHTLYKSVGAAPPQHAANTSGGSSEVNRFKYSRHHLARRENHNQPVPPSSQSSLSTSLQISSIRRRNVMSIISSAICRSSPSVGIRPAPKTGSQSVRGRSLRLGLRNHRAPRQSIRNQIYIFGRPDDTLFDRLCFRNDPFGHEGVH